MKFFSKAHLAGLGCILCLLLPCMQSHAQVVIRERVELRPGAPSRSTAQDGGEAMLEGGLLVAPAGGELRLRFRNAGIKQPTWQGSDWPGLGGRMLRIVYNGRVWEEDVASRFGYAREYQTCYDSWDRSCCVQETFYAQSPLLVSGPGFIYRRRLENGWVQQADPVVSLGRVETGDVIDLSLTYFTARGTYALALVEADPATLQGGRRLVDYGGISLYVDEPPPAEPVSWGAVAGYWGPYASCVGGREEHVEVLLELVTPQALDHFAVSFDRAPLRHGQVAQVFAQAKDALGRDLDIDDETLLNLSLVKGAEFGGLRQSLSGVSSARLDRVRYGSIRTGKSGASGVVFVADGENPVGLAADARAVVVVVKKEGDPAVNGTAVLEVKGRHGLAVDAVPDTIGYGEAALLRVQAIEPWTGQPVTIPDDTPLLFALVGEGAGYGRLQPSEATYGIASREGIVFVADGARPDSLAEIEIYVQEEADPDIGGVGRLVLEDRLKLEIEIPVPRVIWPTLPGGARGGRNQHRNNIKDEIIVRVQDSGRPVAGQAVQLEARMRLPSGGHEHGRHPETALMGGFNGGSGGEFTGQTEANGELRFSYRAPSFGGIIELFARIERGDRVLETSGVVTVKVPDLVALVPNSLFELVGAPGNHSQTNDPCRGAPPRSVHHANHYGTSELVAAVQNIAAGYQAEHPGVRLRLNDMSLSYGGLFDISNDWRNGHAEHRIGKQADIGFTGVNNDGACAPLNLVDLHNEILLNTSDDVLIHSDHYHIRIR